MTSQKKLFTLLLSLTSQNAVARMGHSRLIDFAQSTQSDAVGVGSISNTESSGRNSIANNLGHDSVGGGDVIRLDESEAATNAASQPSLQVTLTGSDILSSHSSQSQVVGIVPTSNTEVSGRGQISNELGIDALGGGDGIHWGQPEAWEEWAARLLNGRNPGNGGLVDELSVTANNKFIGADREGGLTTSQDNMQLVNDNQPESFPLFSSDYVSIVENSESESRNRTSITVPVGDIYRDNDKDEDGLTTITDLKPIGDESLDRETCGFIQEAIGIGVNFGIEANCYCIGTPMNGLQVNCNYDECAVDSNVCGSVEQNFFFGDPDGTIDMTSCTNFSHDGIEDTCFSYTIDIRDNNNPSGPTTQACRATYGGQQCECSIEDDICLSVDCSQFLPGAKIDNCQLLSMTDGADTTHGFPHFEVFQQGYPYQSSSAWESKTFSRTAAVLVTASLLLGQFW